MSKNKNQTSWLVVAAIIVIGLVVMLKFVGPLMLIGVAAVVSFVFGYFVGKRNRD